MKVPYGYLPQEYAANRGDIDEVLEKIRQCVEKGDFTLGDPVGEFEEAFAQVTGYAHAVAVNSGTDALFLAMKAMGVGYGNYVVTVPNTFVATVGAICATRATPVFTDVGDDYLMRLNLTTEKKRKLNVGTNIYGIRYLPVELTGRPLPDDLFPWLNDQTFGPIIVDSAQSIGSKAPQIKDIATYSLHPLKNVHVWGDGGVVCTNHREMADAIRLTRNHGLRTRDEAALPGYNSRLDSVQAIVGLYSLRNVDWVTEQRNRHARVYDEALRGCEGVTLPPRSAGITEAFHTYVVQVDDRAHLIDRLLSKGIDAKVHYPIPLHLQPAFRHLGYEAGDLPVAEAQAKRILSLPVHEYLAEGQIEYVVETIRAFYAS